MHMIFDASDDYRLTIPLTRDIAKIFMNLLAQQQFP